MSAEEFSKTRIGKTYLEPDPQEMSRLREKYRGDKSDSMTDTPGPPPMAGIDFRWEWIAGLHMRLRKFMPLVKIDGDIVGPRTILGYGFINAELPNPDVQPEQRIISLRIQHKSDFKSISNAHLDRGVRSGANELIILYEHRRGLFGTPKPCIHVAGYPVGTWQGFVDAVDRYAPAEFRWPPPLFVYEPTDWRVFPPTKGLNQNAFRP